MKIVLRFKKNPMHFCIVDGSNPSQALEKYSEWRDDVICMSYTDNLVSFRDIAESKLTWITEKQVKDGFCNTRKDYDLFLSHENFKNGVVFTTITATESELLTKMKELSQQKAGLIWKHDSGVKFFVKKIKNTLVPIYFFEKAKKRNKVERIEEKPAEDF